MRNGNGGAFALTLTSPLAAEGSQAMRIDFDGTVMGYSGASRAVTASDWAADGLPVRFLFQRTEGTTGDPLVQVISSAGTFSAMLSTVPGYDPDSYEVQDLVVPLELFLGQSWSNPATPTLSGTVQSFDLYVNGGSGTIVVDDVRREAGPSDTTAPTVSIEAGDAAPSGWHLTSPEVTVTAADDGDLAYVEYRTDGGAWVAYTGAVSVPDGVVLIEARATDAAGNVSEVASVTLRVDTAAPQVSVTFPSRRTAAVQASDATSGVATVEYRVGDGRWRSYRGEIRLNHRADSVQVRVSDVAGNVSEATYRLPVASSTSAMVTPWLLRAGRTIPTVWVAITDRDFSVAATGTVTVTVRRGHQVVSTTTAEVTASAWLSVARVQLEPLPRAGSYTVEVSYSGDANVAGSTTSVGVRAR